MPSHEVRMKPHASRAELRSKGGTRCQPIAGSEYVCSARRGCCDLGASTLP